MEAVNNSLFVANSFLEKLNLFKIKLIDHLFCLIKFRMHAVLIVSH